MLAVGVHGRTQCCGQSAVGTSHALMLAQPFTLTEKGVFMTGVTYNKRFWYGHHVRMSDYETVKRNYETTVPIQGERKKHGIDQRPLSVRRRVWEVWHRDGDSYGMAFRQCYKQTALNPTTKKYEVTGYHDSVSPFLMMTSVGALIFTPKWMNSYATWEMLSALLPDGIRFAKFGSKQYFRVAQPDGDDMYYLITGLDMTFVPYESGGKRYYQPTRGVVSEERVLIDRAKSKQYREEFQAFLNYFQPMADLLGIEADNVGWKERSDAEQLLNTTDWLVRKDGDEYGEKWVDAIQALLKKYTRTTHKWVPDGKGGNEHQWTYDLPTALDIRAKLKGETLYRMVKPYKVMPVPLGTPFMPNNRSV